MKLMLGRTLAHSSAPVAAVSANLAAGCVGLFAPLATVITSLGLDWLHWWDVQQPILYGASVLALASLAHSAWRHRTAWPLVIGAVSVGALLYPLHEALDVTTFRILMNGGAAGLAAAAIWSLLEGQVSVVARLKRDGSAGPPGPGDIEGRAKTPVNIGQRDVNIVLDTAY